MLIELIIEFKWKWSGPPAVHVLLPLVIFMTKLGTCKKNHRLSYYLLPKYCSSQCTYLLPPTWAKSFTKFGPKMQDSKRVLDLNCT